MLIRKTAIDMTEDGWDINERYEELFGSAKRVNLFDSEEECDELRQYIITQPQITPSSGVLPFDGIALPTIESKSRQNIENIKKSTINESLICLKEQHIDKKSLLTKISPEVSNLHLFFIKEEGVCDAKGYFDKDTKFFYICKNSLVSYDTDIDYLVTDTEKARENFLEKACEEEKGFYRVVRDAKCRSASAAASYVLGRMSDHNYWTDIDGMKLSEIYPDVFSAPQNNGKAKTRIKHPLKINEKSPKTKEQHNQDETRLNKAQVSPIIEDSKKRMKVSQNDSSQRFYYITRENKGKRSCAAKGIYDKVNGKFVIKEGSELSLEVTSSYRYTASDIRRNKFIQLNCKVSRFNIKLKRDAICNSPDEAASFVLGEKANGWVEWKSYDGISLESFIYKV